MTTKNNTFRSDSMSLCSFLLCHSEIELLGIETDSFNHSYFILSNPEKCQDLRQKYLNRGLVSAIDLFAKRELLLGEIKSKSNHSDKGGKNL